VEADAAAGLDVGKARAPVQEQGQLGALAKLKADGAATDGLLGLGEEIAGEDRAKRRRRAGHDGGPGEREVGLTTCCPSAYSLRVARQPLSYF
jgi:hypothetical protein